MNVDAKTLRELHEILDACAEVGEDPDTDVWLSTRDNAKLDRLRAETRELWLSAEREESDRVA